MTGEPVPSLALSYLDEQQEFYDSRSARERRQFHVGRIVALVLGAGVSVLAGVEAVPRWVLSTIGGVLVVVAGLEQLFQWQDRWTQYRASAEALRQERVLYLAHAGPYAGDVDRDRVLAERVALVGSQEGGAWAEAQRRRPGMSSSSSAVAA